MKKFSDKDLEEILQVYKSKYFPLAHEGDRNLVLRLVQAWQEERKEAAQQAILTYLDNESDPKAAPYKKNVGVCEMSKTMTLEYDDDLMMAIDKVNDCLEGTGYHFESDNLPHDGFEVYVLHFNDKPVDET